LTVSNALSTRGTTLVEISGLPPTNNVVNVLGTLTFGGTLVVTNVGSTPLVAGDSFRVFQASSYNGAFSSIVPPTPGSNLLWDASTLVTDGTLSVIACCTNNPPVLASISNQMVVVGTSLTITNVASDPDSPPEVLTFSLGAGAATNASINAASGVFNWTPLTEQVGTNIFSVVVTDSGSPPLSAKQSFAVVVVPSNAVRGRVMDNLLGTNFVLTWSDPSAILQSATNVAGPYLDVPGGVSPWSNGVSGGDQRFFRLRYP
jgi:hypothetical protein